MSRGFTSAAVGAAGATVYLRPELVQEWARNAVVRGSAVSAQYGVPSSNELQQLSQLVEQLSREVRVSKGVTFVQGDSGRSSLVFYTVAATCVGGAAYLLVFRGWRLADLCYVTQRTFRQGVANVAAGLDSLSARVVDIKTRLQARIAEVAQKQDEAAAAQAAMRAHLAAVGADVEAVRGQVGQIHGAVLDMDAALAEVGANQRAALHGIYILCKAVGELAQGSSIPSKNELLEFTQSAVWQRVRPQGLEGILRADGNAPDGRLPFMLGTATSAVLLKTLPSEAGGSRGSGAGLGFHGAGEGGYRVPMSSAGAGGGLNSAASGPPRALQSSYSTDRPW